ncbi:MAG: DoxX family membrane protein [Thermoanaerobaculia bacterium]|nr:DoxX family membrane protein [Thermoanaerobaculia bacterium]
MDAFLSLGRWIFPVPFAVQGLLQLMNARGLAGVVPAYMPEPVLWVYFTGCCLIAGAVSMYIGKYDKLAATLIAVLLVIIVLLVHVPGAMAGTEMSRVSLSMLLKDIGLAAGAMLFAQFAAKDRSFTG